MKIRIPDEVLIADLRRVAAELNKNSITSAEYRKLGQFGESTLLSRFGSWSNALAKAGLEITILSDDNLLADLKRVAAELNKNPFSIAEYRKHGRHDEITLRRRFGSWSNALVKAGLDPSHRKAPEQAYLDDLAEVWAKLGRKPCYREMRKPLAKFTAQTYAKRFGTWNKALMRYLESIPK